MTKLDRLLKVTNLLYRFQKVKRRMYVVGEDRKETSVEHSYQLALTAWYLVVSQNLNLDLNKILKYALVHDLAEAYAGDTPVFDSDEKYLNSKAEREEQARKILEREFPQWTDLHELIASYEEKHDREAKFVYALDKILPVVNNYLDNGRTWKEIGVSFERVLMEKTKKVAVSPEAKIYFEKIIELMKQSPEKFFRRP